MSQLSFQDFSLSFKVDGKYYSAIRNLNLGIEKGSITALIGESGCGKSAAALSLIGLPAENAKEEGKIIFEGEDLLSLDERAFQRLRGDRIAMIFQEPLTALNPLMKSGEQVLENLRRHSNVSKKEGRKQVLAMLKRTGLHDPERIYSSYPHQLSGGQRQRIMIACAFINHPSLIIADEMTTALDVTVQAEIISLVRKMSREEGTSVLLISHNLALVRNLADTVYIMYSGVIAEEGETREVLTAPLHPYTVALLDSIPSSAKKGSALFSIPGTVPSIEERPESGCPFAPRCSRSEGICFEAFPEKTILRGHSVCCHKVKEAPRLHQDSV